jgi:polyribonucleotide nucleotidyltransferase
MFNVSRKELMWGGRKLVFETGKIARQADGAVMCTYGETTVLATVVGEKQPKPGLDFFPLTSTTRRRPSPPARSPAAFSSAKAGPAKRKC